MEFDLATILSASKYAAILVPLMVLIVFALVVYRSRSTYPILASLWQITAGKRVIANETIARYVQGQHDLASFKFFSQMPAVTVTDAAKLIDWSEHNHVGLPSIKACGEYFDVETLKVNASLLPTPARQARWAATALVFLVLLGLTMYATLSMRSAYMSFKDDGQLFVATIDGARTIESRIRFWNQSQGLLNAEACELLAPDTPAPGTSFSMTQTELLCDAFGTDELGYKVDRGIAGQRILTLSIAALLLIAFWRTGSRVRRTVEARKLLAKLEDQAAVAVDSSGNPESSAEPTSA